VPIVLSQGPWNHIQVAGRDLFGIVDYVTGSYMVAIGGLLTALYVAISWGWQSFRDETNVGSGPVKINIVWMPFVRFIIPIAVALVLPGVRGWSQFGTPSHRRAGLHHKPSEADLEVTGPLTVILCAATMGRDRG
jgi:hypothetical protein